MLTALLILSCQTDNPQVISRQEIEEYSYKTPCILKDGWETAQPDPPSISVGMLEEGVGAIRHGDYPNIHSILIACQGKLIFEEYFPGYTFKGEWREFDYKTPHTLQSVTKSVTSLVMVIACDQGYIESIDTGIFDWYPEYKRRDRDEKEAITLRHMLTMQSGLDWDGWSRSIFSWFHDLNRSYRSRDPIAYVLRKKLVHEPGTTFNYSSGSSNVLGDIVSRSTSQSFDEYAEQHLFRPLGITDAHWDTPHPGIVCTSGGLRLRPRDLLKIGQLILQDGEWDGRQIVSRGWLEQSLAPSVKVFEDIDYGFQWWRPEAVLPASGKILEPFVAAGTGGQYLMVFPELQCVLVITGGNYRSEDWSEKWYKDFFLPALIVSAG